MVYSPEILLFNILQYLHVLLSYKFLLNVKVFLQNNFKHLNILCRNIPAGNSIKREAIIIKINQVYNEIDKIPSVQSGKKRIISNLLEEALDSLEDVNIFPESEDSHDEY